MKIFILFLTLAGFMGCCNQITPKTGNKGSEITGSNENIMTIRYINNKKGESKDYVSFNNEGIRKLISEMLIVGEPLRIHYDEDEMKKLFYENDFLEISFIKPQISQNGSSGISKFIYFLSGTFKNDHSYGISYFFVAAEDGQIIQSPFSVERNTRNEFESYLMEKP